MTGKVYYGVLIATIVLLALIEHKPAARDDDHKPRVPNPKQENIPNKLSQRRYHSEPQQGTSATKTSTTPDEVQADDVLDQEYEVIEQKISRLNLSDRSSFHSTLKALRSRPGVGKILTQSLKRLEFHQGHKRDKLLFIAGKLETPELLPFWKDLLLRQTPRFKHEPEPKEQVHPGLDDRLIAVEQLQAIRKLGQIAFTNSEARRLLFDTALGNTPKPQSLLNREQAAKILAESDPHVYLKLMARLSPQDSFYPRIYSFIHREGK